MNNNSSTGSNTNIMQLVQTYLDRLFTGEANEAREGQATRLDPVVFTQDSASNAFVNSTVQGGNGYFQTTTNDVPTVTEDSVNAFNAKVTPVLNFLKNLPISRTFMADQQLSSVSKQVKEEGKSWAATTDRNAVNVYANGFSSQTTVDGVALFSNSHETANGTTVDNLETGTLTDANLNVVCNSLRTQLNQSGVSIGYNPDFLFVPVALHRDAMSIAKSVLRAGGSTNDLNYWSELFPGMKVVYNRFLDLSGTANALTNYFVGAKNHGVTRFDREGFSSTMVDWQYNANDQYMYKMRSREAVDSIYYNGLVGSNGTV